MMFIGELMTVVRRQERKWAEQLTNGWGEKKDNKSEKEALESMSVRRAFLVLLDTYFMTSYCCAMYMYAQNLC